MSRYFTKKLSLKALLSLFTLCDAISYSKVLNDSKIFIFSALFLTEFKFLDEGAQNIDMESEATLEDYRNEEYITSEK